MLQVSRWPEEKIWVGQEFEDRLAKSSLDEEQKAWMRASEQFRLKYQCRPSNRV